jgi:RNA polymerase sigma-70 factor (ECF subfamily)
LDADRWQTVFDYPEYQNTTPAFRAADLSYEQTALAKDPAAATEDFTDFDQIVENYSDFVYNVAFRMMGAPEDAQDVAQDAFLSAYRAFDRFRGESRVTTWLYRITTNAALMKLRKEKKARTLTQPGVEDMVIADWSDAPERLATNTELGAKLNEGISMLPDELKAAVVLRDVEGLSNTEAAEILDITVSSLKSRLHRGRVMLRKHLEDFLKVNG